MSPIANCFDFPPELNDKLDLLKAPNRRVNTWLCVNSQDARHAVKQQDHMQIPSFHSFSDREIRNN